MGLARPRSREKKKKEKSHTRSILCQILPRRGGATGYSIGNKFGRLVGPADFITPVNFNLDRLRTGCVALHESFQSFRFSALHRLSPLTQLGPAGPLVIKSLVYLTSLAGPVGRQRVKDEYLCEWKTANFGPPRGRTPSFDLHEINCKNLLRILNKQLRTTDLLVKNFITCRPGRAAKS